MTRDPHIYVRMHSIPNIWVQMLQICLERKGTQSYGSTLGHKNISIRNLASSRHACAFDSLSFNL